MISDDWRKSLNTCLNRIVLMHDNPLLYDSTEQVASVLCLGECLISMEEHLEPVQVKQLLQEQGLTYLAQRYKDFYLKFWSERINKPS